jgi:hypothetical protein
VSRLPLKEVMTYVGFVDECRMAIAVFGAIALSKSSDE